MRDEITRTFSEAQTVEKEFGTAQQYINYLASRFNFQKYRYRNYTADQQVYRGYIQSSLGAACISRYEVAYPEPDKKAFLGDKESKDKKLIQLISAPNQWMSETDWDRYTIKYQLMTGNCYWIKIRKGGQKGKGDIEGLFPFDDRNMSPVGTDKAFIEFFRFTTYDGKIDDFPPEDIIHMPWFYINPIYPNKGIAPGALADLEVDTDQKLSEYLAAFVANNATPNGYWRMDAGYAKETGAIEVTEATAKKFKGALKSAYDTKHAGEPGVVQPGWEYDPISSPLKDLALDKVRLTPEARTCALYLIPPEVAGVASGMAHSTENNLAEARIRWVNMSLIPLWVQNGKKFSAGLQDEFPGVEIKYMTDSVQGVREQTNSVLAGQAQQLLAYVTAYAAGSENAKEAARYIFNLEDETLNRIFPKMPPRSEVNVTAEGSLVNAA